MFKDDLYACYTFRYNMAPGVLSCLQTVCGIWWRSITILVFLAFLFWPCFCAYMISWLLAAVCRKLGRLSVYPKHAKLSQNVKCVLIMSGAKGNALHLTRLFKADGYKTIVCETVNFPVVATAWSNCCDYFYKIPDPLERSKKYVAQIIEIAKFHKANFFIPMEPRHNIFDSRVIAKIQDFCFPLTTTEDTFEELENQASFCDRMNDMDLRVPFCQLVTSANEAMVTITTSDYTDFIIKPLNANSRHQNNIDVPKEQEQLIPYLNSKRISRHAPFVLQNRLSTPEYASCTMVVNGNIVAHQIGNHSSMYQHINSIQHVEISEYVHNFVYRYPRPLNGWLTLDFMQSPEDGHFYPVECQPSLNSSYILFNKEDGLIKVLEDQVDSNKNNNNYGDTQVVQPSVKEAYWLMNELWLIVSHICKPDIILHHLLILITGKEATFDRNDPLPFMMLNFAQIPALIIKNLFNLQPFKIVDYCSSSLR